MKANGKVSISKTRKKIDEPAKLRLHKAMKATAGMRQPRNSELNIPAVK
jgi:hypothetical protein